MDIKDCMLRVIEAKASRRAAVLAGEFIHAGSEEKEDILAGIEFEQWLADSCREVRQRA